MKQPTTGSDVNETRHDNVHELISRRWSPRAFSDRAISPKVLHDLFEAASFAASSRNEQPWRYVYAHREDPEFERFVECLVPTNAVWAKNAAVLMLSYAALNHRRNQLPNRFALHDTGAANTTLMLQAASINIYGHMMGGYDMEKTIRTFDLGADMTPVCFIALGYLGERQMLDEALQEREAAPRKRHPVESFAFRGKIPDAI